MRVTLIRHGKTAGNMSMRYVGVTDEPLCGEGRREAESISPDNSVKRVYVSPLIRTRETAEILFPQAEQIIVPDFREMDFGAFENRSAQEMADDADYRAWVDGMCEGRCPGGESMTEFCRRAILAFEQVAKDLTDDAVFVIHGGVIMAVMWAFAEEKREFYDWQTKNLGGFSAELTFADGKPVLRDVRGI